MKRLKKRVTRGARVGERGWWDALKEPRTAEGQKGVDEDERESSPQRGHSHPAARGGPDFSYFHAPSILLGVSARGRNGFLKRVGRGRGFEP